MMKYAKLLLIFIKQLVDLNFDKSYMTKKNQKPLLKTRFMLDELGNLQSEKHGIANFGTMLSIGLGQDQQFTLILQTLQQLRDVYGESADKIIQGNISNIFYIKSTDDQMLATLEKMSGVTHKSYTDDKTVTKDLAKIFMQNEGKVSYNTKTTQVPVISVNDMAFIPPCNMMLFRAGESPIWNRNETAMPMSWCMFGNTITKPGREYTLLTVPTSSTAMDFDVRKNQPNFVEMVNKRLDQAIKTNICVKKYAEAYSYSEYDISLLDPDIYSNEIMELVGELIDLERSPHSGDLDDADLDDMMDEELEAVNERLVPEENTEVKEAVIKEEANREPVYRLRYAGNKLSRHDLGFNNAGEFYTKNDRLDLDIAYSYFKSLPEFKKDIKFEVDEHGRLYNKNTGELYIDVDVNWRNMYDELNNASSTQNTKVYSDMKDVYEHEKELDRDEAVAYNKFIVKGEFYNFLGSLEMWGQIAQGSFERVMTERIDIDGTSE